MVVIGAGVAGLTAASHLFEYGIRNVTVLEATNRPGGRIHSCWMGDMIAEMGAHPLRNQQSLNSIYTMAAHDSIFSMSSQDKYEQKVELKIYYKIYSFFGVKLLMIIELPISI